MKDIEGYEGLYAVTKDGRVWSYLKKGKGGHIGKWKTLSKCGNGNKKNNLYYTVSLHKNGKTKRRRVHRLVAQTYIPNPKNKPEINHIDGNKFNNNVYNLEWNTRLENIEHAIRTGLYLYNPKYKNGDVWETKGGRWCTKENDKIKALSVLEYGKYNIEKKKRKRQEGDVWKRPSGRWYTKENGLTIQIFSKDYGKYNIEKYKRKEGDEWYNVKSNKWYTKKNGKITYLKKS